MKIRAMVLVMTLAALLAGPGIVSAQPAARPWVFYGEEPWGGSYLGVDTQDITLDRVTALHLKEEAGVEVTMVDQDAPAGKAGIKEHDVILSINDQKVESVEQLRRMIHEIPPGRTVSVGISRDGQPLSIKAQLTERNKMPDMNFNFNMPAVNVPAIHIPSINMPEIDVPGIVVVHAPRSSGMMIENLTPQLAEFFGVKSGNGVLVRSVDKGSRAEQAGIRAGDVIVKINGSAVNDCSDFSRLLLKRTSDKASITMLRDKREQTVTLSMPEPRHTGSLDTKEECGWLDAEATCAEFKDNAAEIAALMPEMTADLKRIQPEMERMKKQIQQNLQPEVEKMKKQVEQEILAHQDQWQKEMRKVQRNLEKQKEQLKQQMKQWQKEAEI